MISIFKSVCPAFFAVASLRASSRPQTRRMLVVWCIILAVLLGGAGKAAFAQTAHFDGAQIASIYGTSTLTGTNVVAIAVDAAGDVVFTTQNPASSSLAFESSREVRAIPAAYHPARRRQLSDGPRNATAQKVNVSSCTYSGVGGGLFIRPVNSSTVYSVGGLVAPTGLTFDSAGNLYVLDAYTGQIYKYLGVNGSIQIESFYGTGAILDGPVTVAQLQGNGCTGGQMATDALGNLYYTTFTGGAVEEIQAVNGVIPPSPTSRSLGSGFGAPFGIAVDSSENVYVADVAKNAVFELVAVNGGIPASPTIRTLGSGFKMPAAVGLDSRGDVYVSDYGNNALKEMVAVNGSISSSPTIEVLGTFNQTAAVTLDRSGNVFVGEAGSIDGTVIELAPNGANFGQINVGTTTSAIQLTFAFDTAGTLGSTAVLTQGATGLDFADAGTGTCKANNAYAAGQSCTINVAFTPKFAGTRKGATVLYDTKGKAIATGYVQGTGIGAMINFAPGSQSKIIGNGVIKNPYRATLDGSGNLYVVDYENSGVYEILAVNGNIPSSPTIRILGSGFKTPSSVAVDGSGDLYVADGGNFAVKEILAGNGGIPALPTIRTLILGNYQSYLPTSVDVDGSGNVYFTDAHDNTVKEILAVNGIVPASPTIRTLGSGFAEPTGLAVDGTGNVYVADAANNAVDEIEAVNGIVPVSPIIRSLGSGFNFPWDVAVDGLGSVYVNDSGNGALKEILAVNCSIPATPTIITMGNFNAGSVSVDGNGNVYLPFDFNGGGVVELNFGTPPNLSFASTAVGSTSTDSPQTVTISNVGNAPLTFPIPSVGSNPSIGTNFTLNDNGTSACPVISGNSSNESMLAAGASCQLPISFAPATAGALSSSLVLTDNSLNATTSQSITLSGTGFQPIPSFTITVPEIVNLSQNSSTASTVTVIPVNGYAGSVQLTLFCNIGPCNGGPISGVTSTFSPDPTTGTSLLTLTASRSATPGTYSMFIAGVDGALVWEAGFQLVVHTSPDFTIGAWPNSLGVGQGVPSSTIISVTGLNGFTDSVNLNVSGLPSGVSASFAPNPTSGTSVLTLMGDNTVAPGTATVTVTGSSGPITSTTTLALTVSPVPVVVPKTHDLGTVNIGSTSPVDTMTFTFNTGFTLGSTSVLTQGATGLDYVNTGTGTCTANVAYATGQSCTVNVTFSPKFAGTRNGAVVLTDNNGNTIATGYLQGAGVGPQVHFLPGTESTVASTSSGLYSPYGVAVDGSGNVYIADVNNIWKETPSVAGYTSSVVPTSNLSEPTGVAVDGAGNIYIADTDNHRVLKETPSAIGYSETTIADFSDNNDGAIYPDSIAVDGSGNVYIGVGMGSLYVETPLGSSYTQSTIPTPGVTSFGGIAVDGNGNIYIIDDNHYQVLRETPLAEGYAQSAVPTSGMESPFGITVDGSGNLYITDGPMNRVLKETPSAGTYVQTILFSNQLSWPIGIAVDGGGNLYIADNSNSRVLKEDLADAPSLSFATAAAGSTSSDSPQTVTIENAGNAELSFPIPATGNNPSISTNFTLDSSGPSACPLVGAGSSAAGTLVVGASCQLAIGFTPTEAGSFSGSLALTDNNLNSFAPANVQNIALSGTGSGMPTITWNAPEPITYGTPLSATQLDATSTAAGSFTYSPAAGTVLGTGEQNLTVTFTPTDSADFTEATATVTLTVNQATPAITWATPAPITYGTPLSGAQLNAISTEAGTFTYSPAAGTVFGAGDQTLTVTFTPTDATNYTTATATVMLTVNQATPTISWAAPAAITYGTPLSRRQLNALSTVAGTFTYSPAAGTVLGAGQQTLTVTFTPTDTTDYTTATATVTLTVNQATPMILWATPAAITYGTPLSGAQLNARSPVAGSFDYSPAAGSVLDAGIQTLTATFTPTDSTDYSTATATVKLTVNKTALKISWAAPVPISYGTSLSSAQLDATSSASGAFVYSPAEGTVLPVGSHTLSVTLTPSNPANYTTATATATVTLKVNKATPAISWASPAAITYGTPLSATQLNATSTVAGTFAYSPAAGTELNTGQQTLKVTFTPSNAANYTTATASVMLTVNKATPTINWATPKAITYGTALSVTQLNATSTVAGSFAYSPAAGTVLNAGQQTLKVTFTPSNATNYTNATASVTLAVNKATPAIIWETPKAIIYGTALSATQLNATSTVAGTFTYSPAVGTVLGVGSHTLTATFTPTNATNYTTSTATVTLTVHR